MAVLFTSGGNGLQNRGRVVALYLQDSGMGGMVQFTGWGGFETMKAIITRTSLSEATHQQFQHTMGNRIYAYLFGDQIGTFNISGLAFADNCGAGRPGTPGIVNIIKYYRAARLTRRQAPLKITIQPDITLEAYLIGDQADTLDPEQNISQFNFNFALIPEDTR